VQVIFSSYRLSRILSHAGGEIRIGELLMNKERFEFLRKDYVQGFPANCGFAVERVVHAGVIATMADHTGGYAAFTTVSEKYRILTIEFKINYFKPAVGEVLICRSKVINNGRKIKVAESEIFSVSKDQEKLVSKAMVTLIAVPKENLT